MSKIDPQLIREWGTEKQFFDELERWHKEHREKGAHAIEYDNATGAPVRAIYWFAPYTVYVDNLSLRKAIAEAMQNDQKD